PADSAALAARSAMTAPHESATPHRTGTATVFGHALPEITAVIHRLEVANPDEGAIPEPQETPERPTTVVSEGRFKLPLRARSYHTDRFGAPRGAGFIHGGIDLAL